MSFSCPHCTYHFRPDDPRLVVPPGKTHVIVGCPGCRTPIRVWAEGYPKPASDVGCYVAVAVIVAIALYLINRS